MSLLLPATVVFPLHGIQQTPDGPRCACTYSDCGRIGKHPAVLWRELKAGDAVERPASGAGVGIKTGAAPKGSGIFVVDIDGPDALLEWERLGGSAETYTVRTGRDRGGWQLYFLHPGFYVRNTVKDIWWNGLKGKDSQGIDTRGEGGYVVASGSPHATGRTYDVVRDAPLAEAPQWLLERLAAMGEPAEAATFDGDITDPVELRYRSDLYRKYLETTPPCIEGNGGDVRLFEVVQHGAYDLALPEAVVLDLLSEVFDPRCDPPWGDALAAKVSHKVRDAKTASTRPRREPWHSVVAELVAADRKSPLETLAAALPAGPQAPATAPAAPPPVGKLPIKWGGWNDPIEEPVYLLQGLIPEGKVCTFFAEGGSVKSWSAFALAISVATGCPWLGKNVRQGRALILDYEDGRYEFQRRRRILMQNGEDIPELGYLYGGPRLNDPALWSDLYGMGLKLIVIDTLGSAMPSDVDENDNSAFSEGVRMAGIFTEASGGQCTVVIVAHANKQGGLRGASSIRDQSDVVFKFEPVSETDNRKRMRMVCDKPGPQKKPAPVNVELTDEGLRLFIDEAHETGRNADTAEAVQAAIRLALKDGPVLTKSKIQVAVSKRRQDVFRELEAMETAQEVIFIEGKGYCLDDEAARKERVRAEVLRYDGWMSAAALAKAAFVSTRFVSEIIRQGFIAPRATGGDVGGFILVDRSYIQSA